MINAQEIFNANILIVDDHASNIELLEQLLGAAGYTQLASTSNPQDVFALHRANRYDLILLDIQMPGMDGFQVMEGLKEYSVDSYLPVIVLTAQPAHKLRALQAGAKDFISKPFDVVEVKTRIYNMLEVRLLYKKLDAYNRILEERVLERTEELRDSEARYRSLTELASDWYWEQDERGSFTRVSGPVLEMLGFDADGLEHSGVASGEPTGIVSSGVEAAGWNPEQRKYLQETIAARKPFLDFVFGRIDIDGAQRTFRVSGEPIFNRSCRFIGYRGIGIEFTAKADLPAAGI